ncbi:MAG: hypothetical protein IPK23_15695 [Rhizobiales bacterium]|nr:hypothetical protein [Hyphomicrobiales bacterium]
MSGVSDEQFALLVEIDEKVPLALNPERRLLIETLLTAGLVRPSVGEDAETAPYELTAQASRLLGERGAA